MVLDHPIDFAQVVAADPAAEVVLVVDRVDRVWVGILLLAGEDLVAGGIQVVFVVVLELEDNLGPSMGIHLGLEDIHPVVAGDILVAVHYQEDAALLVLLLAADQTTNTHPASSRRLRSQRKNPSSFSPYRTNRNLSL